VRIGVAQHRRGVEERVVVRGVDLVGDGDQDGEVGDVGGEDDFEGGQ
jgi:hypothetical protein